MTPYNPTKTKNKGCKKHIKKTMSLIFNKNKNQKINLKKKTLV
jgi:hypothetical protein